MRYEPTTAPLSLGSAARAWLSDELRRIANVIGQPGYLQLDPIDVEPQRPSKGMIVWAVGVNWDPGAGQGLYVYNEAGAWDRVN